MTGYELHDLLAANRELISDTWNYFLTVHLAVFGIIYIASGRITRVARVLLVFAYLAFMYINYSAQMDNYGNYERLFKAVAEMPADADGAATAKALLSGETWITPFLMHIYGVAASVSALIIMVINRGER